MTSTTPTLAELIRAGVEQGAARLHVSMPAVVETYDNTNRLCSAQPLLRRLFLDGTSDRFPVVVDVPVVWLGGGAGSLTMPLAKGDQVVLMFADRSLDAWLQQRRESTPDDVRKHHLSDGFAIPVLDNSEAHPTDVRLALGVATLALQPNGKVALGTSAVELLSLVNDIISALQTATVATGIGPQALDPATQTQLTVTKNLLGQIKGSIT